VRELGIGFVAYSPLGRGFLTGKIRSVDDLEESDARRQRFPRFERENLEANLGLVETVEAVAQRHGATPGQVALAWVLSRGDDVVAIPGTKRVERLEENLGALELELTAGDVAELDRLADSVAGMRYGAEQMQALGR
jgi:aryl-alcohol dehydrogenase-like predicted oxidoreductase